MALEGKVRQRGGVSLEDAEEITDVGGARRQQLAVGVRLYLRCIAVTVGTPTGL